MIYSPENWYWVVGGSTTQVYSSAEANYVSVNDTTYQSWIVLGGAPTHIDAEENLWAVVNQPLLDAISALDSYIPRGLEDMWSATGFDTTKLPAKQQARLAEKAALRIQIKK